MEVFKQVAVLGGRFLSVFDGETEYALGRAVSAPPGAFLYACATMQEAVDAPLPRRSRLRLAPRAVLRCSAWGAVHGRAHGRAEKLAVEWLRPEELLPMPIGYTTLVRRDRPPLPESLLYDHFGGAGRRLAEQAAAHARLPASPRRPTSAPRAAVREALAVLRWTFPLELDEQDRRSARRAARRINGRPASAHRAWAYARQSLGDWGAGAPTGNSDIGSDGFDQAGVPAFTGRGRWGYL